MKRWIPFALAALSAAGCSATNGGGGPDSDFANVQVLFTTQRPGGTPLAQALAGHVLAAGDTVVTGTDTLVLDVVQVVLREIELKRVETQDCDAATDEDACEKFATGPVLIALPLGSTVQQQFELDIPPGDYNEIEFDIHKPDDGDPDDQAFVAANPDFADISIRVTGTFNGQAFTFTSDLNVEQELALSPVLSIVDSSSATSVTIFVDVDGWFRDGSGALIGPATANKGGPNEGLVKENIKNSVEAFEDHDRDGDPD